MPVALPRALRIVGWVVCWLGNAAVLWASSAAEPTAAAPVPRGLSLTEVIAASLASSPDILSAVQRSEAARGTWLASGGAFDFKLSTSGSASRNHTVDSSSSPTIQSEYTYALGAQRLFRNGVLVQPTVSLKREGLATRSGQEVNAADVGVTVAVPLLRDRGGSLSEAPERTSALEYKASRFDLDHAIAQRAQASATAYWDYVATQRRLEVQLAAEERAQRTLDEMRVLVEADERPSADLTQVMGNLSSKRVTRISAEQSVVEARQQVGLAMGLAPEAIVALPPPNTDFPSLVEGRERLDTARLIEEANRRRADLAAAEEDVNASRVSLDASRSELRPRLDLFVDTGYRDTETGPGFSRFFAPLHRHEPKLDASVQLKYERPIRNSAARGKMMQNVSTYQQRLIAHSDLRRRIVTGVTVAYEALVRGDASVRESEHAVQLFESSVAAEQRKFQVGVSTLFDLIQAQNDLTNAHLGLVQSQRNYAVAVATLRFQSGTLLDTSEGHPSVPLSGLLTPP